MQRDGGRSPVLEVEGLQGRDVEVREHIAVHDQERLVEAEHRGGETNGARGVEGFGFDGVVDAHAGDDVARVGLGERLREIAQGEDRVGDVVARQPLKDALDHGHAHEGQHLFGRLVGEGP